MDIKGFVKNHKKKIIAIGTVIVVGVVSLIAGASLMSVLQCLLSTDPASPACALLQATDALSVTSITAPQ